MSKVQKKLTCKLEKRHLTYNKLDASEIDITDMYSCITNTVKSRMKTKPSFSLHRNKVSIDMDDYTDIVKNCKFMTKTV